MTAAEFWIDAPGDQKAEVINGVMIMTPPSLQMQEELFGFLFSLIRMYSEDHDLGKTHDSRTGVELAPDQVYEILSLSRANDLASSNAKALLARPTL